MIKPPGRQHSRPAPMERKEQTMKYAYSCGAVNIHTGKNGNFAKFIYAGSKKKQKVRKKGK